MGKDKINRVLGKDDVSKFDGFGVDFKCKLIGFTEVPTARGDDICQEAISKLKLLALKMNKEKKEHKQRITVNITFKGIRLLDEQTERIEHAHPIQRISYISHDNEDKRTFGYIVGTKEGHKLFAIRTMKEAEHITKTLKELFQEVFHRHQVKKQEEENKQNAEPEGEGEDAVVDDDTTVKVGEEANQSGVDTLLDWGQLNEQIEVMQSDGLPRVDSMDMLADPVNPFGNDNFAKSTTTAQNNAGFNPFGNNTKVSQPASDSLDFCAAPPPVVSTAPPSNDLFSLNAPVTTTSATDHTDAPLLLNDPFAELKKNINKLHKQNQMQQQYGFQASFSMQPGPFQMQPNQVNNSYMAPNNNPFGTTYGVNPMQSGNPMQSATVPPCPVPKQRAMPASNPFMQPQTTAPPPAASDMGWTVTKQPTHPQIEAKKMQTPGSDPFAFLNNQTGAKPLSTPQLMTSNNAPSNDLFDLLG